MSVRKQWSAVAGSTVEPRADAILEQCDRTGQSAFIGG
jgi:hypothetical protein